jgi:hypothetical protein
MKQLFLALVFAGQACICVGQEPSGGRISTSDLDTWRQDFETSQDGVGPSTAPPDQPTVSALNRLNGWLKTGDDVRTFRDWNRDDDVVQALIPLAAGSYSETRLPATFILGNVVDNTNVCRVLDYLKTNQQIEPNGRYNLLQVVLQVSEYAFDDNAMWINGTVSDLEKQLAGQPDTGRTLALLESIKAQLQKRSLGKADRLETLSPSRFASCAALLGQPSEPSDATANFPSSIEDLTRANIQKLMFTPDRRKFAQHLARLYEDPSKKALAHALVDAIIPPGQNPQMRYRVNLYIALTVSLLPRGSIEGADATAFRALLQSAEMKDATFADNVRRALQKQGLG